MSLPNSPTDGVVNHVVAFTEGDNAAEGDCTLFAPHLMWSCTIAGPVHDFPQLSDAMLDTGNLQS
jgi:hypothetical protein